MESSAFNKYYKNLNPLQREAVDTIEGPVMVVAGPGTGKTQILTLRIANILQKTDVPPDAILALTFTEAGVLAMRKRLVSIIGSAGYRVGIFTFHSFCNDLIKRFPEEFPRIIGSTNLSDIDKITIIKELIENSPIKLLRPYGDTYYYLHPVRGKISELKRENISPDDLKKMIETDERNLLSQDDLYHEKGTLKGKMKGKYETQKKAIEKNKELLTLFIAYEEMLRDRKMYDYEDMILEVIRALESSEDFRLRLQEEFIYILADEHQDANNAQNKLLELLTSFHQNPNLFIVGDEKQAIYRFQGASLENFLYFKKKFPGAQEITLEENYRSTQSILDAAHKVIDKQKLTSRANHKDEKITLYPFSTREVELEFIADDINKKIKEGVVPEEIAVLYRDNKDADELLRVLEKSEVPFVVESDQNILFDADIQKFLILLKSTEDFGDERMLIELLHIDFLRFDQLDLYKVMAYARSKRVPIFTVFASRTELENSGVKDVDKFARLYNLITSWRSFSFNRSLPDLLEIIARESGLIGYFVAHAEGPEKLEKLSGLFEEVKSVVERHREYRLKDLLAYFDLIFEHNVVIKKDVRGKTPGRVRLMTAHRSKGLEFDYVYIFGVRDGHFGGKRSRETFKIFDTLDEESTDADERRLFYVALTRARKCVYLTYSKIGPDGKEKLPSQFVEDIDPSLIEIKDTSKIEEEINSQKALRMQKTVQRKIPIDDRQYLGELFKTQGLSVTALNNYLECPWRYFYNNLIRVPHVLNKHMLFGNALHATLKDFFDKRKVDVDMTSGELLALFEMKMKDEPFSETDFLDTLEKGKLALSGYWEKYKDSWPRNVLNEFKIKGILFDIGGDVEIPISGALDKIEMLSGSEVNVVDYKTGKPKTRNEIEGKTKSSDGNYKRQIIFYKLLLDMFDGGRFRFASGEIDFVEPDERGKYHKEKFLVSDEEVSLLKNEIKRVSNEILDLKFWDSKCKDDDCEYCALRKLLG